jgi:hypothetical protein
MHDVDRYINPFLPFHCCRKPRLTSQTRNRSRRRNGPCAHWQRHPHPSLL